MRGDVPDLSVRCHTLPPGMRWCGIRVSREIKFSFLKYKATIDPDAGEETASKCVRPSLQTDRSFYWTCTKLSFFGFGRLFPKDSRPPVRMMSNSLEVETQWEDESTRGMHARFWRYAFCSKFQHNVTCCHFESCTPNRCQHDLTGESDSVFERQGPWDTWRSFSHERALFETETACSRGNDCQVSHVPWRSKPELNPHLQSFWYLFDA